MFKFLKTVLAFGVIASTASATAAAEGEYYQGAGERQAPIIDSPERLVSRDRVYPYRSRNSAAEVSPRVDSGDYWDGAARPH